MWAETSLDSVLSFTSLRPQAVSLAQASFSRAFPGFPFKALRVKIHTLIAFLAQFVIDNTSDMRCEPTALIV